MSSLELLLILLINANTRESLKMPRMMKKSQNLPLSSLLLCARPWAEPFAQAAGWVFSITALGQAGTMLLSIALSRDCVA